MPNRVEARKIIVRHISTYMREELGEAIRQQSRLPDPNWSTCLPVLAEEDGIKTKRAGNRANGVKAGLRMIQWTDKREPEIEDNRERFLRGWRHHSHSIIVPIPGESKGAETARWTRAPSVGRAATLRARRNGARVLVAPACAARWNRDPRCAPDPPLFPPELGQHLNPTRLEPRTTCGSREVGRPSSDRPRPA